MKLQANAIFHKGQEVPLDLYLVLRQIASRPWLPVGRDDDVAIGVDPETVSRRQFVDALEECPRPRHIAVRQIERNGRLVDFRHDQPRREQRLDFRCIDDAARWKVRPVNGLDAEPVADQFQRPVAAVINGDTEHAVEHVGIAFAEGRTRRQCGLHVAPGTIGVIRKSGAQFYVVVDFAIPGEHPVRRGIENRLVSGREIDDGKSAEDRHVPSVGAGPYAVAIRATMAHDGAHRFDVGRR